MMYGVHHAVQIGLLIKALGVGYLLGMLYTVYSVVKNGLMKNRILILLSDILISLVFALVSFVYILDANHGVVRFYIIAGEIIGFCLCCMFSARICDRASALIKKAKEKLLNGVKKRAAARKKSDTDDIAHEKRKKKLKKTKKS